MKREQREDIINVLAATVLIFFFLNVSRLSVLQKRPDKGQGSGSRDAQFLEESVRCISIPEDEKTQTKSIVF